MSQQVKDLMLSLHQIRVAAMVWVQSLAWELPHATGMTEKKKKSIYLLQILVIGKYD